jgi:hypothetical protein
MESHIFLLFLCFFNALPISSLIAHCDHIFIVSTTSLFWGETVDFGFLVVLSHDSHFVRAILFSFVHI